MRDYIVYLKDNKTNEQRVDFFKCTDDNTAEIRAQFCVKDGESIVRVEVMTELI